MRRDLKLLVDAIDMHAHTHPALFNRPIDDADLASHAMDFGMRASCSRTTTATPPGAPTTSSASSST